MKRHLLFASVLCVCMASKAEIIRPTFDSSSYTNTGNEAASKLVDDAGTSTKWGMGWSSGDTAWIIVQADHTILNGYELYNGNDTASQQGRRWKSWRIEGSTDKNSWTTIEEKTNAGMTTSNYAKNAYTISDNTAEYNYYRITVLENEGGTMIQMSDLKFNVTYTVTPEYTYKVWSDGLPAGVEVYIKGTKVDPDGAWTVGGDYTSSTNALTVGDVEVRGLGGGAVYSANVDNANSQINIEVKDLFTPSTSTTENVHEYIIKDASNRFPFVNSSSNIWHTTTKGEASRFLFIESGEKTGKYYIYDNTAKQYYIHTSNTGSTVSATSNSSVKLSATQPSEEQGLWVFDTQGHIMPTTQNNPADPYGWNFTGDNGHPLNLYKTSDGKSAWQILDPMAASLACAVTMFAEPGKEYMHKLIPEDGDVINSVEFGAGINNLQYYTDRQNTGHRYVYVKGTAPTEEGTYTYVVKSNAGNTTVTLTVSNYLPAPTPTMGWLSWNWFESWAKQDVLVENARAMKERGLVDAGYKYFILDDKWAVPVSRGATKANLTYDTAKFPEMQNGSTGFNDVMHELGFWTGIYSDAGRTTCASGYQPGSYGYEAAHVEKFNNWGFDMVKYDYCNSEASARVSYPPMGKAIKDINVKRRAANNPRPMALNICEWGQNQPWLWGAEAGGSTWRCTGDSREAWYCAPGSGRVGVLDGSDAMKNIWMYGGVNRFNDADMMMIGLHGCGSSSNNVPGHTSNGNGNLPNPLTVNQARSQMSIWSMFASPLTMCADFRANPASLDNPSATLPNPLITEDDLFTLMNPNIIAINQDVLGQQAEFMESLSNPNAAGGCDVYVKDLSGNRRALAVVNRSASSTLASKSINLTDLYLDGSSYYVKDVWTGKVKQVSGAIETGEIGISETKVYIISSEAMEEDDFSSFFQGGVTPEPEPEAFPSTSKVYRLKNRRAGWTSTNDTPNVTLGYMKDEIVSHRGRNFGFSATGDGTGDESNFVFESDNNGHYFLRSYANSDHYVKAFADGSLPSVSTTADAAALILEEADKVDGVQYYFLVDSKASGDVKYLQACDAWWGGAVAAWKTAGQNEDNVWRCQWAIEEVEGLNYGGLFSNTKTYKFVSKRNDGVLYAPESASSDYIVNTVGKNITVAADDTHQQFAIIASPKFENAYYLYSVAADKFLTCTSKNTNTKWTLSENPVQYVTFEDNASNFADYPWFISATDFENPADKYYAHMGNQGNAWSLITWLDAASYKGDGGNGWKVEEVDDFDPAKLQAALAKINVRENPTVDPEINLGAVDVDGSKYPFILSTSADDLHWHYLTIRGNKYVSYNSSTGKFSNAPTAPTGDAGLFAFIPVSENTVKIINKALGTSKAIGGTVTNNGLASVVDYANGLEFIYENNGGHDVFAIKGAATNAHVNDIQSQLGFWVADQSATDDGSTFSFTPTEVLVSTDAVKHYYTIRNNNNPNNYAHYAGDNQNLSLGSTRNNQAVFYFTSAGANANGSQLVNIHNYMAEGKTMNDWNVWNSNAAKTWYVKLANGTDALNDFNIGANDSYANSWNHQAGGVKSWGAGTDKGSAWFLEEVFEKTYTLDLSAADVEGYTLYNNGQAYTDGQKITGFFFDAASFTTDEAGEHPFDGTLTTVDGTLVFGFEEFNTVTPGQRPADISEYALWYNEPATKTSASDKWMEYALPLGNGQIGATFLGGLMTDNIQFNEKTLWRGGPGRGADGGQGYFQNFGSVLVRDLSGAFSASSDAKPATGYARYLDIMNGVGGVRYNSATTQYKRNYFTSAPDKVLVAHYTAEGTDKLNLLFSYAPDTQINASAVTYDGAEATFSGKLHVVKYNTRFRVLSDGDVTRTDDGIEVANGTYATLVMAAATDYDAAKAGSVTGESAEQLATRVSDRLGAAAAKSYDELLAAHVTNFSGLMGRVDIDFGGETSQKTTEELIKFYNQSDDNKLSADGLYLEQLYFQYGRYMTIGANNDLSIHAPSNLQGIWNDRSNSSFWHCDVHADINVEMNYWPADPTNLSEMHRPFLDHILDMAREDGPWSQLTHGNPGWTIDCENNIFGGTSGWSQNDMKTLGAWYCSHLWRYYRYTKDREFLKKALPVMYRNAVYLKSIATLDTDNTYVISGEWSPEHSDFNTITAFAQQTTAEVCDEIIKAHAELGTESTLTDAQVAEISAFYDKLDKGIKIENYTFTRAGKTYTSVPCIAEWKKIALKDPGHRHLSHLMCIYPFEQISAYDEADAANFAAARNGILARTGDVTGWSMGWQTNVYARCLWGNEARGYLSQALRHSPNYGIAMGGDGGCYYNLFDAHSPFQIDGNYGCTSGVAEMLVQSYDDKVHLLPALPNAWADGHAKGLKAIGNFTVDQEWANGELTSADITSNVGGKLEVVYGSKKATIENTRRGETYHFDIKNGQLDYNLVDATIVTITDYIEDAQNGTSYDAQKIEEYKNLILKLQK